MILDLFKMHLQSMGFAFATFSFVQFLTFQNLQGRTL